jgi:hypothetical protein
MDIAGLTRRKKTFKFWIGQREIIRLFRIHAQGGLDRTITVAKGARPTTAPSPKLWRL